MPASKPEFGDFQINCALALAKEIKQPRNIAQQIANQLQKDNDFENSNEPILQVQVLSIYLLLQKRHI